MNSLSIVITFLENICHIMALSLLEHEAFYRSCASAKLMTILIENTRSFMWEDMSFNQSYAKQFGMLIYVVKCQ